MICIVYKIILYVCSIFNHTIPDDIGLNFSFESNYSFRLDYSFESNYSCWEGNNSVVSDGSIINEWGVLIECGTINVRNVVNERVVVNEFIIVDEEAILYQLSDSSRESSVIDGDTVYEGGVPIEDLINLLEETPNNYCVLYAFIILLTIMVFEVTCDVPIIVS